MPLQHAKALGVEPAPQPAHRSLSSDDRGEGRAREENRCEGGRCHRPHRPVLENPLADAQHRYQHDGEHRQLRHPYRLRLAVFRLNASIFDLPSYFIDWSRFAVR